MVGLPLHNKYTMDCEMSCAQWGDVYKRQEWEGVIGGERDAYEIAAREKLCT